MPEDRTLDICRADSSALNIILSSKYRYHLLCGCENGAKCTAMIYSFVESYKLNGINVLAYFDDILKRLPDTKKSKLRGLLPYKWISDSKGYN